MIHSKEDKNFLGIRELIWILVVVFIALGVLFFAVLGLGAMQVQQPEQSLALEQVEK